MTLKLCTVPLFVCISYVSFYFLLFPLSFCVCVLFCKQHVHDTLCGRDKILRFYRHRDPIGTTFLAVIKYFIAYEEVNRKTASVHFGIFEKTTKFKYDPIPWKMNTNFASQLRIMLVSLIVLIVLSPMKSVVPQLFYIVFIIISKIGQKLFCSKISIYYLPNNT